MAHPLKKSETKRAEPKLGVPKVGEPKLGEPKLVGPESAAEITIAQEMYGESVSDTLIRARQQLGQDLRSIAEVLCIRFSYLDAIERGQYENLPGPTYAMGFVRTYAEYLGLDGDQIVDRFKSEVEGIDSQTKLHFPTPAPEGKMPGGAVFLVAALLFAGAYGVWFYLSNQGESLSDLVAPVPEQLQNMVDGSTQTAESLSPAPAAPPAAGTPTPAVTVQPDSGAAAPLATPATDEASEPGETPAAAASGQAAGDARQPGAEAADQPATQPATQMATGPQENPGPAAPSAGSTTGSSDIAQRPSETTPAAPESAQQAPEQAEPAPAAEESAAVEPARNEPYAIPVAPDSNAPATAFLMNHEPTVYGDENADARIVLKANQDAWVQVRDRQGNLLLTRVLRVGDSYMVPNQADLTLLTGNAGGLEISVDGSALPALGPVGAVRRNIPLDPEALRSGAGRQP